MQNDTKIYIFDVDDTIVQRWTTNMLRNRKERIEKLKERGAKMYLATNQGGPAYHAWHYYSNSGRAEEYPTLIKIIGMMAEITAATGAERCYVALHPGADDVADVIFKRMSTAPDQIMYLIGDKVRASYRLEWRKPLAGMLLEIIEETGLTPDQHIYIGNETRDMLAAQAAGIEFIDSDEFFLGEWQK